MLIASRLPVMRRPLLAVCYSSLIARCLSPLLFSFLSITEEKEQVEANLQLRSLSLLTYVYVTQVSLFFFTCTPRILFNSFSLIDRYSRQCFFLKKKKFTTFVSGKTNICIMVNICLVFLCLFALLTCRVFIISFYFFFSLLASLLSRKLSQCLTLNFSIVRTCST